MRAIERHKGANPMATAKSIEAARIRALNRITQAVAQAKVNANRRAEQQHREQLKNGNDNRSN